MIVQSASALGLLYLASEVGLGIAKRAGRTQSAGADGGSLALLWCVIGVCTLLAFGFAAGLPQADFGNAGASARFVGVAFFAVGLSIRWYAVIYLGRFFTVNVSIAADHRLIDRGPYRWVRHPSYTGALFAFFGLGLCLGNWVSLACLTAPVILVFLHRIRIEEAALLQGLGEAYRLYELRTKRLIPGVY